jgi:hypothetical protein
MSHPHPAALACLVLGLLLSLPGAAQTARVGVEAPWFGEDSSRWARDGACDDPRFVGPGMSRGPHADADLGVDGEDCGKLYEQGQVWLRGTALRIGLPTPEADASGIDFGSDSSLYAFDGECDDPQFDGPGMSGPLERLDDMNLLADAADCREGFEFGTVWPRQPAYEPGDAEAARMQPRR